MEHSSVGVTAERNASMILRQVVAWVIAPTHPLRRAAGAMDSLRIAWRQRADGPPFGRSLYWNTNRCWSDQ